VIPLTLHDIAAATGGRIVGDPTTLVRTLSTDSREVRPDSVFVALTTVTADGHDHAAEARRAGAVALLAERPVEVADLPTVVVPDTWLALRALATFVRERVAPTAVAVTGSVGKTTVKDLTAAAVGAGRRVHAARGSFNNELGVPLTLLGLELDDEVLVAEVGARHEGDIATLAPMIAPDVAVVTAVAAVHLEVFGSLAAIGRAKGELVEALGPHGLAVLHGADPLVAAMAASAPASLLVALDVDPGSAGSTTAPDVWAEDIRLDRQARPSATAVTPWGRATLRLPIAGRHQLLNGLFALTVAGHLGVDLERAAAALADAPVSPWRGAVDEVGGVVVLDDAYNANPTAVAAALQTLVALERTGAAVAVLGEMAEIGPTAAQEHRAIGRRCAELGVDRLVVVGAAATALAAGAREAGMSTVEEVPDATAAAAVLRGSLVAGDAVLVKASRVAGLERIAADLRVTLAAADGRHRVQEEST
jgi:UDP-N-acetylmuramoyl-tripeptide--D-alanyl-D-alanine ligase